MKIVFKYNEKMKFAIVTSKKDIAGMNIASFITKLPTYYTEKDIIYAENIDKKPELKDKDFLVFASRHASKEERKTLSLHVPGNWKQADFGGKPGKICKTSAFILKYLFQELAKNNNEENLGYEVTLEVTHHGPLIEKPCCFIEIGSTEQQWQDKQAATIIAKTILSLQNYEKENWIPCIGIGGLHYAQSFNKIQLNSEYALSHIIPKYHFPLTKSMLEEAEQKTLETVREILVDWKGCGKSEERQQAINVIKRFGIEYKRTNEIEK